MDVIDQIKKPAIKQKKLNSKLPIGIAKHENNGKPKDYNYINEPLINNQASLN
jgi:hypothetical protein